jgi:hypothetical protein
MAHLYKGAVAPEKVEMVVGPGLAALDLSTVSSARFVVQKPTGEVVEWECDLSDATPEEITLTYPFGAETDIDVSGEWRLFAELTVPEGRVRTDTVKMTVRGTHGS